MGGFQSTQCVIRDNADNLFVFWWIHNQRKRLVSALHFWFSLMFCFLLLSTHCMIGNKVERESVLLFICVYLHFQCHYVLLNDASRRILRANEDFSNSNANDLRKNGNQEKSDCSNLPVGQLIEASMSHVWTTKRKISVKTALIPMRT